MDTKVYSPQEIKEMLLANDKAVIHGVVAIWKFQTSQEKTTLSTVEHNGVGFNGVDAQFLSSLAEQVEWKGRTLSAKQIHFARKAIIKYTGQLTKIANGQIRVTVDA